MHGTTFGRRSGKTCGWRKGKVRDSSNKLQKLPPQCRKFYRVIRKKKKIQRITNRKRREVWGTYCYSVLPILYSHGDNYSKKKKILVSLRNKGRVRRGFKVSLEFCQKTRDSGQGYLETRNFSPPRNEENSTKKKKTGEVEKNHFNRTNIYDYFEILRELTL